MGFNFYACLVLSCFVCVRNSVIITVLTVMMTLLGGCVLFVALGAQLLLDVTDIRQLDMSGEHTAWGTHLLQSLFQLALPSVYWSNLLRAIL